MVDQYGMYDLLEARKEANLVRDAEINRLRNVIERLSSSEAFTAAGVIDGPLTEELRARMGFARDALSV